MHIEKLFGSKAKTDILKYLLFCRQGISIRALEAHMEWTFPAIKKQVDVLEQADIVSIHKDSSKRSITIRPEIYPLLKNLFVFGLKNDLATMMTGQSDVFARYYLGTVFGHEIGVDLILVYLPCDPDALEKSKIQISDLFKSYGVELVYMTIMAKAERDKRLALADKFVLSVLRVTDGVGM